MDDLTYCEWTTSLHLPFTYEEGSMIGEVNSPSAEQLRPITLTSVSYKLYISCRGKLIDQQIIKNDEVKHIQAGFNKGTQIEDNLFILQYSIHDSLKQEKALSIEFSKAFDSIKGEQIVLTMMKYKIHPKIINTLADIYKRYNNNKNRR